MNSSRSRQHSSKKQSNNLAGPAAKGLNITVPHKSEVVRLVSDMSDRASNAGAVNTLVFRDGEIHGDNTDGVGLMRDLQSNIGVKLRDTRILVLGAGGATRGIIAPLLEAEPETIVIANRTIEKAQALAQHFSASGPVVACRFQDVGALPVYDLIINATSAGLKGETPPYPVRSNSRTYRLLRSVVRTYANTFCEVGCRTRCRPVGDGLGHAGRTGGGVFLHLARSSTGDGTGAEAADGQYFLTRGSEPGL